MKNKNRQQKILLPLARHFEERPTVSQSVRQAGKQPGRQAVSRARQAGRQKHTVWLFSVADYNYKNWGTYCAPAHSVVEWLNTRPMIGVALVQIPAGCPRIAGSADRPLSPFVYSALVQILLTTNV